MNNSNFTLQTSPFACLRATHRQAAGNNLKGLLYLWERLGEGFGSKAKKETPAPINRKRLRKKFPGHTLRVKAAHADESSKSLSKANPVEFDGVGQKPIPSNSKGLKHSIYADQNHSAFIPQNSLFAYGATVPSEQKETPGPLNRKRSRKGSWGQRREDGLASRFSQTLYTQNGLIPWINQLQQKWHKS